MELVFVIGGCGGLGQHIVKQLLEEGYATNITVFDKNISRNRIDKINYIAGDLGCSEDVHNAFRNTKPRVVFHTASPMLFGQNNSPDLFEKINIAGTQTMLEAICAVQSIHALIYTGTSSVVHNNLTDIINATEDWPKWYLLEQTEYYTHTKAVAEDMILAAVGRPISPKDIRVVPSWLFYLFAVFAEWGVWMVSLGRRGSHLNRKMVRYFSMTRTFDITKAKKRLGYRPRIGTEDAIKRSVEHFLARREDGKKDL